MNKVTFKSKKEASELLKEKGIDTSNWTEEKWQSINKSQAEIHIQAIAELMWDAYNESAPKELKAGEWHIPFGDQFDLEMLQDVMGLDHSVEDVDDPEDIQRYKVMVATARCARISYETLGDNPKIDYKADIKLHDILVQNGHASPLEHCAKAMSDEEYGSYYSGKGANENWTGKEINKGWCRNFKGFIQYRAIVEESYGS